MRILGVPTVSDRIAQTVVKQLLEPVIDPIFHANSYGYRPGRSAHDAIAMVRRRSWEYDWVIEFDIKGLFDNIDHSLLMRALRKHCKTPWVLMYVERWLKAPMQMPEGNLVPRTCGTPQGGVVSPLLANLFLHYAFDKWVGIHLPSVRFCRYADDGIIHCRSKAQAEFALTKIRERFLQCNLELHSQKTTIIYCKDINRKMDYSCVQFTFLGYTFRPRKSVDKYGRVYVNFAPAVSRSALKAMRQTIRGWHLQLKCDKSLSDLSSMFNPILRGWYQYYGKFHSSAMYALWNHLNGYLARWLMRKYKRLARHKTRAGHASSDWQPIIRMLLCIGIWDSYLRLDDGSRMSREVHVRFCEGPQVKFLRSTHPYIPMKRGFLFLTAIIDVYSRYIVGWGLSNSLEAGNSLKVLDKAISDFGKPEMVNLDQGSQFTCEGWVEYLKKQEIIISMDGKGRCLDNIWIERFWRTIKQEYVCLNPAEDGKVLFRGLKKYLDYYNNWRTHRSLDRKTPFDWYEYAA